MSRWKPGFGVSLQEATAEPREWPLKEMTMNGDTEMRPSKLILMCAGAAMALASNVSALAQFSACAGEYAGTVTFDLPTAPQFAVSGTLSGSILAMEWNDGFRTIRVNFQVSESGEMQMISQPICCSLRPRPGFGTFSAGGCSATGEVSPGDVFEVRLVEPIPNEGEEQDEDCAAPPQAVSWAAVGDVLSEFDFFAAGNWTGGEAPQATQAVSFSGSRVNSGTVRLAQDAVSDKLTVSDDFVQLRLDLARYTLSEASACPFSLEVGAPTTTSSGLRVSGGVIAAQSVRVGARAGEAGVLALADISNLEVQTTCVIGDRGNGLVDVQDSAFLFATEIQLSRSSGGHGRVVLNQAENGSSEVVIRDRIIVGARDAAEFEVAAGILRLEPGAQAIVGQQTNGGVGLLDLEGDASRLLGDGDVIIAEMDGARGKLSMRAGAAGLVDTLQLAAARSAFGELLISGSGAALSVSEEMVIALAGEAEARTDDGGDLLAGRLTLGRNAGANGALAVSSANATLIVTEFTVIGESGEGRLTIENGAVVQTGINAGSDLEASSLAARPGSRATVTVDSATWRNSVLNVGFEGTGDLVVRNGGVVESREAIVGNLAASVGDVTLENASAWTIEGRLIVGLDGIGRVDVDGTSDLFCEELFIGDRGVVNGRNVFVGQGPGAGGAATGLRSGAQALDDSGIFATRLVVEQGAELNADSLTLRADGEVSGDGALTFDLLNPGTLSPGGDAVAIATLTVNGDYEQTDEGVLVIDAAGLESGDFDLLRVTGNALLAGGVDLRFVDGFVPQPGDTFDFVQVDGTITGIVRGDDVVDVPSDVETSAEVSWSVTPDGTCRVTVERVLAADGTALEAPLFPACGAGLCGAGVVPMLPLACLCLTCLRRTGRALRLAAR